MSRPLEDVRVLLVEDDPIIALDIRDTREAVGAVVVGPAHNVAAAEALVRSGSFDVAVLDHLIIGGDSLPVAHELVGRGLQFLFHTSHRGRPPERYPDAPVIDKPSRPDELVAAVRALVDTSRLRR
jgi:DNA-binding response OmpR family regulator